MGARKVVQHHEKERENSGRDPQRRYKYLLNPHAGGFERRDILFQQYGERSFADTASDRILHVDALHPSSQSNNPVRFQGNSTGVGQGVPHSSAELSVPNASREFIGNMLYAKVESWGFHGLAGKITGMLLDLDNEDLQPLLVNDSALRDIVDEAREMLVQQGTTSSETTTDLGQDSAVRDLTNDSSLFSHSEMNPSAHPPAIDPLQGILEGFSEGVVRGSWQTAAGDDSDLEMGEDNGNSAQLQQQKRNNSSPARAESAIDFLLKKGVGRSVTAKELAMELK